MTSIIYFFKVNPPKPRPKFQSKQPGPDLGNPRFFWGAPSVGKFPHKMAASAHSQKIELRWLVVEPTPLKNMLVKMGSSSPKFGGENKKSLKPPPRSSLGVLVFSL